MDSNKGEYSFSAPTVNGQTKKPRKKPAPYKHRPRVLKSQYDNLKDKYEIVRLSAIIGWSLAFTSIALNMIFWFM